MAFGPVIDEAAFYVSMAIAKLLPPQEIGTSLHAISSYLDHSLASQLGAYLHQPLDIVFDIEAKLFFIASTYNQEGQSYRSPWSNQYFTCRGMKLSDSIQKDLYRPTQTMRDMEIALNTQWDAYRREIHYNQGVSSAYIVNVDQTSSDGFFVAFALTADLPLGCDPNSDLITWEELHGVKVALMKGSQGSAGITISSNVNVRMKAADAAAGKIDFGFANDRTVETTLRIGRHFTGDDLVKKALPHIARFDAVSWTALMRVVLPKAQEVVTDLRSVHPRPDLRSLKSELVSAIKEENDGAAIFETTA